MNEQLQQVDRELRRALERLRGLAEGAAAGSWEKRPKQGGWSASQCIQHLNLTSEASLPLIRQGLEELEQRRGTAPTRLRRDPMGWLIWRSQAETARMRTRTSDRFTPGSEHSAAELVTRFEALQHELLEMVQRADGLPLGSFRIRSPFNSRVRYNLYSALSSLAVHQHRHLAQAERAAAEVVPLNPTG
jgi:hypothetical protein